MKNVNKKKGFIIIIFFSIFFWFITDFLYSTFINKGFSYGCLNFNERKNFYDLKKNCISKEKIVKTSPTYKVFTDKYGYRFSGNYGNENSKNKVAFLGDSFTYGVGLNFDKTFVGKIKKIILIIVFNLAVPSYSQQPIYINYKT